MGIRSRITAAMFVIALAGCEYRTDARTSRKEIVAKPPGKLDRSLRYDATSEATRFRSQEAMTVGMSPEESEQLQADLDKHIRAYAIPMSRATPDDAKIFTEDLWRPLHGLTAAEIHIKAEEEHQKYKSLNEQVAKEESLKDSDSASKK